MLAAGQRRRLKERVAKVRAVREEDRRHRVWGVVDVNEVVVTTRDIIHRDQRVASRGKECQSGCTEDGEWAEGLDVKMRHYS